MKLLKDQAIQTALLGRWNEAILINQELLKESPDDIDTLNRLGFALAATGNIKDAKNIYQRVLKLDSYNPIASRNLKRLVEVKLSTSSNDSSPNGFNQQKPNGDLLGSTFLEETGKTKVIELVNIAEPKVISRLQTGTQLELCVKRLKVFVLDKNKQYVGMLPDNVGKRLVEFLKGGNCYKSYVRSVKNHSVCIFVKETTRAKRFKNQPSFISLSQNSKYPGSSRKTKEKLNKLIDEGEEFYSVASGFGELEEESFGFS